jgi:hypothetical protein
MDARRQPSLGTATHWVGLIAVPFSIWFGALAKAALAPDVELSALYAGWMAIFVLTIVPVHVIAYAATFALMRNRLQLRHSTRFVVLLMLLAATGIAFSHASNPFQMVFGAWYTPAYLLAYAVAAGRPGARRAVSRRSRAGFVP